jgi:hypothetical protein
VQRPAVQQHALHDPTRKGGGAQRDRQIGRQATRVTLQNNKLS